jgi:hypothetical protein
MDESGMETLLEFPIEVGENSITTYEEARTFFTFIHSGAFKDVFTRLSLQQAL